LAHDLGISLLNALDLRAGESLRSLWHEEILSRVGRRV
jgi:hypothetical protein